MLDKMKLVKLLRALAVVIESSTDEEIAALSRSSVSDLTADARSPKRVKPKHVPSKLVDDLDIPRIIDSLKYVSSRDAGLSFLERHELSKNSLERIARQLDVPVLREDSSAKLARKIIEATVGPRLNSEAIRGEVGKR